MLHALRAALEESSDGKLNEEIEKVFYCRLDAKDVELLNQAAGYEDHLQWEIDIPRNEDNAAAGRLRVRMTVTPDAKVDYVLTSKIKMKGMSSEDHANLEVSTPSSEAQYKQFQLLAGKGMIKRRFFFPVPNSDLVWEVDVFPSQDKSQGGFCLWLKLDLELTQPRQQVPAFPLPFVEVIGNEAERTEQQDEIVKWLYDNEYLTPNPLRRQGYTS